MRLDCRKWDAICDDYLSGTLESRLLEAFLLHADACPRCRGILDVLEIDLPAFAGPLGVGDEQPDLVASIMDRTTGTACDRAGLLLADAGDPQADGYPSVLLAAHLEHCERCADLARILAWLGPQLQRMGEIEPETDLTYGILKASSRARSRKRAGTLARVQDRLQLWWEQQVARPRFAWEVAFVATVILVLVFGTPVSPARKAPSQALVVMQAGPGRLVESAEDLAGSVGQGLGALRDQIDSRNSRTGPDRADIKRHGREAGASLLAADLESALANAGTVGRDFGALWRKWLESEPDTLFGVDEVQESTHR